VALDAGVVEGFAPASHNDNDGEEGPIVRHFNSYYIHFPCYFFGMPKTFVHFPTIARVAGAWSLVLVYEMMMNPTFLVHLLLPYAVQRGVRN